MYYKLVEEINVAFEWVKVHSILLNEMFTYYYSHLPIPRHDTTTIYGNFGIIMIIMSDIADTGTKSLRYVHG